MRINEVSRGQHPFACGPLCHDGHLTHVDGDVARRAPAFYPDLPFFSCDIDKGVLLMAKGNIPESLKSCFCILLIVMQATESLVFPIPVFFGLIHLNFKESGRKDSGQSICLEHTPALLLNLRTLQLHPTSEVGFSILAAGGGAPEAPGWPEKGEHDDFGSS